jgi:hypothetical protein
MKTQDINPDQVIGRTLAETELLIKHLQTAEIGQVFTYQEMTSVAKDDVQLRNTILQTARRTLMKPPHSMVFGTIKDVGVKRLSDEEIPDEGASAVKRSRNIARSGFKKLGCADVANMTPETKVKHITMKTILGLFNGAGSRKVKALAEQSARTSNGELKIGNVAELFSK